MMILAVGAIAGAVLVAGLAARRPAPTVDSLRDLELAFDRGTVSGRIAGGTVSLRPLVPEEDGEVGVYWASPPDAGLTDAFWLGSLGEGPRSYRLPDGAEPASGEIVLYAFERRRIVDRGRVR